MILRLRDDDRKAWSEINKNFVESTGIKVAASTLRMRYTTMKANFTGISEEDVRFDSFTLLFKTSLIFPPRTY